jgi:hypothetical protein
MSEANVRLFAAGVDASLLTFVEHTILFWDRTHHNTRGLESRPHPHIPLLHQFNGVSSWWGSGHAVERGSTYVGPLFCSPGDWRDRHTGELKK